MANSWWTYKGRVKLSKGIDKWFENHESSLGQEESG